MKTIIHAVMLGAALFWSVAHAQQGDGNDDEHAGHHPPEAAAQEQDQAEHHGGDASAGELQKNANKMQDLVARIQQTNDPAQKRDLLAQHLQAMREQIKLMQARAKAGMMGTMSRRDGGSAEHADHDPGASGAPAKKTKCAMMGENGCKMMKQKGGGMTHGGMMMMHKQVEQRLQAIEQLLEQMIEYETAEAWMENR